MVLESVQLFLHCGPWLSTEPGLRGCKPCIPIYLTRHLRPVTANSRLTKISFQNDTLVTFGNIRFAAAPLGPLRFNAPAPPPVNRTAVQNASGVICPQAYPKWLTTGAVSPFTADDIPPVDPRTSEDCLFLDVLVPQGIWETRQTSRAPVLVWIPGGVFVVGWKDASGQGHGLVTRSQQSGSQGVILVSINYRLGLFVSSARISSASSSLSL